MRKALIGKYPDFGHWPYAKKRAKLSEMHPKRKSGTTTRQIDDAIQFIFNHPNEWHPCIDHHYAEHTNLGTAYNRHLLDRIVRRIDLEHPRLNIVVDRKTNAIKLIL